MEKNYHQFSWLANHPLICSAPLHGISNSAQRQIFKKFGADVTFSEMVSSIGLHYRNKKSFHKTFFHKKEKPVIIQIFGNTLTAISEAARFAEKLGADGVDFNCGCPARNMLASGNGGKLLLEPDKLIEILVTIKKTVKIPVSLKTRLGYDQYLPPNFYRKITVESGIDCLILHGRTVKQQYQGQADWPQIKKIAKQLSLPVIGNGDITSPIMAVDRINNYTPSGIMIGRGSLGSPWIFVQTKKLLARRRILSKKSIKTIIKIIKLHTMLMMKELSNNDYALTNPEKYAILQMRKHYGWYIKNIRFASTYRQQLFQCENIQQLDLVLKEIIQNQKNEK